MNKCVTILLVVLLKIKCIKISVCLENNLAGAIKQKLSFGPFQVLLDEYNAQNDVKRKLEHVGGFKFFCSMKPSRLIRYHLVKVLEDRNFHS